ncbi:MAG: hypothetical protein ACLR0U_17045 [Enterocloster clostridioformis]
MRETKLRQLKEENQLEIHQKRRKSSGRRSSGELEQELKERRRKKNGKGACLRFSEIIGLARPAGRDDCMKPERGVGNP